MVIHYLLDGTADELEVAETEDLAELCHLVERELRAKHPTLSARSDLAQKVTDGLLNGLAGDEIDIKLGELQ